MSPGDKITPLENHRYSHWSLLFLPQLPACSYLLITVFAQAVPSPEMSFFHSLTHQSSAPRKLSWTTPHHPVLPSSNAGAILHHSLWKWDICLSWNLGQVVSSKKVGVLFMVYLQPLAQSLARGKCSISTSEWIDKWVLLLPTSHQQPKVQLKETQVEDGSEKQQGAGRVSCVECPLCGGHGSRWDVWILLFKYSVVPSDQGALIFLRTGKGGELGRTKDLSGF